MILSAKIVIDKDYKGKTKHPFFHNTKKGDMVTVSTEIKTIERNWGLDPTLITFRNHRNGEEFITTMGQTNKYLRLLKHSIM